MPGKKKKKQTRRGQNQTAVGFARGPVGDSVGTGLSLSSNLGGFPDQCHVRLVSTYLGNITMTSGAEGSRTFYANSAFDPFNGWDSAQPSNFDLFAAMYQRYKVMRAKMVTTAVTGTATAAQVPVRAISLYSNTSTAPSILDARSNPRHKTGIATLAQPLHLNQSVSMAAVLGQRASQWWGTESNGALTNADPTDIVYYHYIVRPWDQSTTSQVTIDFTLIQDIVFTDRIQVTLDLAERLAALRRAREAKSMKSSKPTETKEVKLQGSPAEKQQVGAGAKPSPMDLTWSEDELEYDRAELKRIVRTEVKKAVGKS